MRLLEIYLDDHWAGAGAGVALARRLAQNNSKTRWAEALNEVSARIAEDEKTLARVREDLGMGDGEWKRRLAQAGERVARLKLNGRLLGYSPLSRVVEAESLIAGVTAKRLLWTALGTVSVERPELGRYDFAGLEQRADEQLATLRKFHREAVQEALTEITPTRP